MNQTVSGCYPTLNSEDPKPTTTSIGTTNIYKSTTIQIPVTKTTLPTITNTTTLPTTTQSLTTTTLKKNYKKKRSK